MAPVVNNGNSTDVESLIGNLSKDQTQHFISLFSSKLQHQQNSPINEASTSHSAVNTSGIHFSPSTYCFVGILTVSRHTLSNQTWVIDSGATHHVAHDRSNFISMDTSVVSYVNLPT